ncbi:hypothetical protein NG800_018465 [Epilithonimonas ginsengisoli]|uniref:Uncharacterized protein n=1 Tax=Epilithonimonas ginsengisoli TaxID=1245592 RepID=A0ABU4JMI8_9FLAO|nr:MULTISPECIES: hypothetical protein [Chryseobacterium group]MBV6881767.1 hypothetical protein [Epilithonimonas sp. FP105]MDW8550917.1 hypothetical protein [Epilithonimonas ginsengisoli]OAH66484.1 hypothetical protein AXA65_17930 [Chryseobacterium sp. FP211-J200]
MGKESFIGGDYIETTGGASKTYAGKNIENSSFGNQFTQNGLGSGVSYATNEEPPIISTNIVLKKFLIHFRRNTTYNGEFGFDWIRDEYIYPITNVGGTNKELSLDLTKLKIEYKTTDVSNIISPYGKDYYCSFLNLMLNQEVTLDIEVEELETLSSDATEILFESSNSDLLITPTNIALSTLIAGGKQSKNLGGTATRDYYLANNQVKVKCNRAFTVNEQIKIFAKLKDPSSGIEDKKEVGKMMVMKNSDQPKYTINVYVIKAFISDNPSFGEAVIDTEFAKIGGLAGLEKYLNENSLNQGLVQVKLIDKDASGNVLKMPLSTNTFETANLGKSPNPSMISDSKYTDIKDIITTRSTFEVSSGKSVNLFNLQFNLVNGNIAKQKCILLYLCPLKTPTTGGSSYNNPLTNKHCIIFKSNIGHLPSYAHEIAHTLGLEHTFKEGQTVQQKITDAQNKLTEYRRKQNVERTKKTTHLSANQVYYSTHPTEKSEAIKALDENINSYNEIIKYYEDELNILKKNPYKFEDQKTENIMDYDLQNQKTFFKWQWRVIEDETKKYYH